MCYMNKNHKRKWLQNYKIKRRVVGTHLKPFWFLCSFWSHASFTRMKLWISLGYKYL
uniref:Uncharacterized protein n=1 Tax=Brassica campestris TaxID=3711 RepID=A0A3P6B8Y7_BRACM|nr:unnamed protein product [Brassica rapa]